jgi:hypothetical protein
LLQSALLLLTMAQSTPNLSQSFQANAVSVAHQAIAEATAALTASSTSSVASTAATTNQTFTTPSGAVIGADGTVLNALTPAPPATATNDTLLLSFGQESTANGSAYISWSTNIPTDSKIFLTLMPVALNQAFTQVVPSAAGLSTQHFVNVPVVSGESYSYTIEAISGTQDQELSGTLSVPTTDGGTTASTIQSESAPLAFTSGPTEIASGPTPSTETVNFSTNYPTTATIEETNLETFAPGEYSTPRTQCTDPAGLSEDHTIVCDMPTGYPNPIYSLQATDADGNTVTASLKAAS